MFDYFILRRTPDKYDATKAKDIGKNMNEFPNTFNVEEFSALKAHHIASI